LIDEAFERLAKAGDQLFRRAGDEIPKPVGLESQPQPLDGIEIRRVARQELGFEVMAVQARGFVPGGIVENEDLAYARFGRHRPGYFIEEQLEYLGVHAVHDETEQAAALRRDRADDVLADVIAQIRHGASPARLHPAPPRPRITFHAAFVAKPQFDVRIGTEPAQFLQKRLSFLFILPFRPGLGHTQMIVQFAQLAQGRAVTQFDLQLGFEIAVELDAGPMALAGLGGVFQHRHEQIAHAFQFDFTLATRSRLGD